MPQDIISQLPALKWRGLEAPCESTPYRGSHSQAERRYPYIDAAGHDWTGRDPYQFPSQRLHFLNTIKPGDWYPTKWNQFRAALEDGSSGDLEHPDLGTVRARVLTWDVDLGAKNRGGIVVDVVWVETVDNLDERVVYLGPDQSPGALAEAADSAMAALAISYPTGKSSTSFKGLVDSLSGTALSLSLSVNGAVNQALGTISGVIKDVETLNDHAAWPLRDVLVSLWVGVQQLGKQLVETQRSTAIRVTQSETTLDAIARDVGNTVEELIGLNLFLVNKSSVPKNTPVTYYTGGVSISSPLRPPGP